MTKAKDELATQSDNTLDDFVTELIAPFSIHVKKYARPHGTVARKQFANRANKRLSHLIATAQLDLLTRLEAEFDRHAKSIGLWGMEGLMLDTLARTGNLSSEQKVERDAMVTERRALAILYGAIQAERAKLKEVK